MPGIKEQEKLALLADIEGYDSVMDMLREATFDGRCMAICMNDGCEFTTEMEPDQDGGWCNECKTNTVKSCLILEGII